MAGGVASFRVAVLVAVLDASGHAYYVYYMMSLIMVHAKMPMAAHAVRFLPGQWGITSERSSFEHFLQNIPRTLVGALMWKGVIGV